MNRYVISGLAMALFAMVSGMSAADSTAAATSVLRYPSAARGPVVEAHHGTEVADPYRWMETASPEVAAWVAAENAVSQPYLNAIPARATIQKRLTDLWNYQQYGYSWLDDKSRMPIKRGDRYFYVEKSGSENQGVLYWTTALDAAPSVLVDPNTLSRDATASLADYSISPDGRYVAYAVSDGGTDWDTWRVREVESGRDLPDLIGDTKFTGVSWLPDASAFYYSRYPKGADGKGDDQQQVSVFRHRLGTPQADDELAYAISDNPRYNPYATVSEDGRWLVLGIFHGFDKNADAPARPVETRCAGHAALRPVGRTLRVSRRHGRSSLLQDDPGCAARPRDLGRSGRANAGRGRAGSESDAVPGKPGRRSRDRELSRGRALAARRVQRERQAPARHSAAGQRHGHRLPGFTETVRDPSSPTPTT